jgi:lactoylglutathione lyase
LALAKNIHSMIRVRDEERSVAFYQKAFGLSVADRLDFTTFTLVYLSNAESAFELELTINKDRTTDYELGDGYGHFAVSVEDLDAEHARFEAEGLAPRKLVEFKPDGDVVARFFFVADPDGYQIEVLERSGRFK